MTSPLLQTICSRLLLGSLSLAAVSVIIFSTVSMLPGNFATSILGQSATPETIAAFESRLGLDQPATTRYFKWVGGILHGDLGESLSSTASEPRFVADIISSRLRNTLLLAGVTALVAVPLSIILGILSALYRGTVFDRGINGVSLTTISIPEFFMAYILIMFVAVRLRWLPTLSNVNDGMDSFEWVKRMALPVMTLTIGIIAHMMRMTRSAIVGVLSSPYIDMAKYKGASPARIILRHALPNAWGPIANVVAVNLAYLVVGVVVVETVFVYPGIGQTMVDAVRTRDIPVVQACALIFASVYILMNLIADVIAIATNPKLLHAR
ncbi:ABC transporter permease [Mesorhizobium dulcispinae]|uniref:ABC transporter permease n=1 Tax=Mesorhizobium dulcispinae TaxID=3072316 RepID=UPI002A241F26|nr:ABC transporter permease [Mesorhizobium sp. VK23D]MDX8522810.1 ABC transporter permease [Mesorhizobium sp. VK23D]